MAQTAIPEQTAGYAVWYDEDYSTYHVSDFKRIDELIDRCFISQKDIVYQHET